MKNPLTITAVAKTFRMLECFRGPKSQYTLTELRHHLGITMGTAQRITHTLMELGYLTRDPQTKAFRLSAKWLSFGYAFLNDFDLREIAQPYLKELNQETNETVNLGILDGDDILYVERFQTTHYLTTNIRPGARRPLVCTSLGKVILAFLEENERSEILNRIPFKKYTAKTIVTKEKFTAELEKIRRQGYAENNSELSDELFAIAVPLINGQNRVLGGINIVIPTTRVAKDKIYKEYLPSLIRNGKRISAALGHMDAMGRV